MNDFQRNDRFGGKRAGPRPSFGGKPAYQRSGGFSRPQGQMHQATCAQCGKSCEVPFRPDGQRPIYCRDCFKGTDQSAPTQSFAPRSYQSTPRVQAPMPTRPIAPAPDARIDDVLRQLTKMNLKLDKILLEIAVNDAQASAEVIQAAKKKLQKKS